MDQAAAERKLQEAVGFTYYPVGSNENWRDAAVSRLWNHAVSLQSRLDKMEIALRFAKEVIDDQAGRFHKGCRCQLCESAPMLINDALGIEGAEVVNWTDPPKEQR